MLSVRPLSASTIGITPFKPHRIGVATPVSRHAGTWPLSGELSKGQMLGASESHSFTACDASKARPNSPPLRFAESCSVVCMTITSYIFEAYLKCPSKCFFRSLGETGTGNAYADWTHARNISYQRDGMTRMKERAANNEWASGPLDRKELKSAKWRLAIDSKTCAQNLESTIHAVERVPCDTPGGPAQFTPMRFIFKNKLSRHDKLMVAFDALVLSEASGRGVNSATIIHGDNMVALSVKTSAFWSEVRKITAKIAALLSDQAPDPVLNRHCAECEFRERCKQKAIGSDDLSLLACITEDERIRYRSKGGLHRHAVVLHVPSAQNAEASEEPCETSLSRAAGTRYPREHRLHSR